MIRTRTGTLLGAALTVSALLAGCAAPAPSTSGPSSPDAPATGASASPAGGEASAAWRQTLASARGETVNFYMWGGDDATNQWVTGWAATQVQERYDITLNMVPVADIAETVNKVLGEKQAGRTSGGSVDLMWINGENFRTMAKAGLLLPDWSRTLPNSALVDWTDPGVANDFGFPVEGYESPYGKAQFVMAYDSAKVANPPTTVPALLDWIKANPGRFAYPAPPDFTGSVFVRHVCYSASGGYEKYAGAFDQARFDAAVAPCVQALKDIEASLWRRGETYPETKARQQDLFANGEVDFTMSYGPSEASSLIAKGRFPATTRTFVFDEGTIANTHYVTIPFNTDQRAAAQVVADFMLSPEAQLAKADPAGWGDLPALDLTKVSPQWRERFAALPLGPATLPADVLAKHRLPEPQAEWLTGIEEAWEAQVLHGPKK